MNMTTKTFPKPGTIPDQNPEQNNVSVGAVPAAPFTWEKLAGHWLRSPAAKADESDATVRRWRALGRESTCYP